MLLELPLELLSCSAMGVGGVTVGEAISLLSGRPTLALPLRGAGLGGLDNCLLVGWWTPGPRYGFGAIGGEPTATGFGDEERISATVSCAATRGGVVCEGELTRG